MSKRAMVDEIANLKALEIDYSIPTASVIGYAKAESEKKDADSD